VIKEVGRIWNRSYATWRLCLCEQRKKNRIAKICYTVKYLKATFQMQACLAVCTFHLFHPCLEHTAHHFWGFFVCWRNFSMECGSNGHCDGGITEVFPAFECCRRLYICMKQYIYQLQPIIQKAYQTLETPILRMVTFSWEIVCTIGWLSAFPENSASASDPTNSHHNRNPKTLSYNNIYTSNIPLRHFCDMKCEDCGCILFVLPLQKNVMW
jgi:hypothetical protein